MIRKLFEKYREQILYIIFGAGTTLVNIVSYYLLCRTGMDVGVANAIAWLLSVAFAYVTNRRWVFESRATGMKAVLREAGAFVAARVASGLMDEGIILLFVDVLGLPNMPIKIASNVLVVIVNYVFAKLVVFRGKK